METVTHVHAGIGRAGGIVDLPVQRDENGFPCIYSSSLKGALKTALLWAYLKTHNDLALARKAVEALLGPEPELEESFESSVAVLDASLVAMPVRSLRGVYAYVTSRLLLEKLLDYVQLCSELPSVSTSKPLNNDVQKLIERAKEVQQDRCLCIGDSRLLTVQELGRKIVLVEEVRLEPQEVKEGEFSTLSKALKLEKPLLVLEDNTARHVIERGLLRVVRVRLKRETKTVENGGRWSEEYVPAKTRFATVFLYKKPPLTEGFVRSLVPGGGGGDEGAQRQRGVDDEAYLQALEKLGLMNESNLQKVKEHLSRNGISAAASSIAEAVSYSVEKMLEQQLHGYIVLGGHETIGKGIVKLRVMS
ncbi:MAG: type III-B CRISPR module RAMP protein Cmr4 [Thermofilaceae archaeon]